MTDSPFQDATAHKTAADAWYRGRNLVAAEAGYRRATAIRRDYYQAHFALGNVLREQRRPEEAAANFREVLRLKPDLVEAHNELGNVLYVLGRVEDAAVSYDNALALNPEFAAAHGNRGAALQRLGRLEEAVVSYRRALEIRPDYADVHNRLGSAFSALGRLDEAIGSYGRALQIKPDFAAAHANLASVLRLQGKLEASEASCRRALALDPMSASMIALLAHFHADRGEFAQAESLFKRAIDVQPDFAQAWAGLALLKTFTRRDVGWLIKVRNILDRDLPSQTEACLRYAAGKYLDDVGNFAQAFDHYRRANELDRRSKAKHDRPLLTKALDEMIRCYDRSWLDRSRVPGAEPERAVFIIGMPRSGTTLAEQILASHPAVFGAGELPFWESAMATYEAARARAPTDERLIGRLSAAYLRLLDEKAAGARRVVDKMPVNFMFLGLIHAALPNARIIHMQRDPLDTCLSIYFQNFESAPAYTNDLEDIAHYYTEYLRLMTHWRAILPADAILEVPYEGLVENQELWSRKLVAFVGLPWDPGCLDFTRTSRTVITASKWQVRQKISNKSVGRWRGYAEFIDPMRRLLEKASP